MSLPVSLPDLPVVTHAGQVVITTELMARAYGVEPKAIHDNYQDNKDRFSEGVHFHRLAGEALKRFKNYPENSGVVGARAPHLMLWTERGAARHAKLISTDEAWAVFGKLEDTYFENTGGHVPAAHPSQISHETCGVFTDYFKIARLIGQDRNQAALSANRAAFRATGVAPLAEIGTTHMDAPQQDRLMTPSDIGADCGGISGRKVNRLLIEAGYQVETRDAKGRSVKVPTTQGEPFAVWQDTPKRHNDGTPVRQLKWSAGLLPVVQAMVTGVRQ